MDVRQKMMNLYRFISISGAILVLIALFCELTIERTLAEDYQEALRIRVEQKIDEIWFRMAEDYLKKHSAEENMSLWNDFRAQHDKFVHPISLKNMQHWLAWIHGIRVSAQLIGGLLARKFHKKKLESGRWLFNYLV